MQAPSFRAKSITIASTPSAGSVASAIPGRVLTCVSSSGRSEWRDPIVPSVTSEGSGISLLTETAQNSYEIKSLSAGSNITLEESPPGEIMISSTGGGGGAVSLSGTGVIDTVDLVYNGTAPNLVVKNIFGTNGTTVVDEGDAVNIVGPTIPTITLNSTGSQTSFVNYYLGPSLAIKSLGVQSPLSINSTATEVTLSADPYPTFTVASTGGSGVSLVDNTGAPDYLIKTLDSGTDISVAELTPGTVTISSTFVPTTIESEGVGNTLVNDSLAPAYKIKSLTGGTNITVTEISAGTLTINGAATPTLNSLGTGTQLIGADALSVKSLKVAGSLLSIGNTANDVTITATTPTNTTLTSVTNPSAVSLVTDGTGPALEIQGLIAGTNISLFSIGDGIDISTPTVTLANASATGQTLIVGGTGPSLSIKRLVAGTNITLTPSTNELTIAASGGSLSSVLASGNTTGANNISQTNSSQLTSDGTTRITAPTNVLFQKQINTLPSSVGFECSMFNTDSALPPLQIIERTDWNDDLSPAFVYQADMMKGYFNAIAVDTSIYLNVSNESGQYLRGMNGLPAGKQISCVFTITNSSAGALSVEIDPGDVALFTLGVYGVTLPYSLPASDRITFRLISATDSADFGLLRI